MATSWTPGLGGGNPIRYVFVSELRTAIDALRAANGLPVYSWTSGVAAGNPVRAVCFSELRAALNDVFFAKNSLCPMFTQGLPLPGTPIHASQLLDLRDWVNRLENGIDPRFGVAGMLTETELDLFMKAGTTSRAITWYHNWNYGEDTSVGMGRFHQVGGRYSTDPGGNYWNGGHGNNLSRFITNYCRQNDPIPTDPSYLNLHLNLADGAWYRVCGEVNWTGHDGANDNRTGTPPQTRHGNAFPSFVNGVWVTTGGPPQRTGECFHVHPSQYARWFWKYFSDIRNAHLNSPVGFCALVNAGTPGKGMYYNNDNTLWTVPDPTSPEYGWVDEALYALDAITWADFGLRLPQVLNPQNFFWNLHFYMFGSDDGPPDFDLINGVYHLKDTSVIDWTNQIRASITHLRGLQFPPGSGNFLDSNILTLIPEFGINFHTETTPDPVDRPEAMTKIVNGVGGSPPSGLKNIEASYRVVAWFWFIAGGNGYWKNNALVKTNPTPPPARILTPLGSTYKALGGG